MPKKSQVKPKPKAKAIQPFSTGMHTALDMNAQTKQGRKLRDRQPCPPGSKKGL
jgi:hypothetical protein